MLDPIAVARELGIDHLNFLIDNPIHPDLKAAIKPLSESRLPGLIELSLESWGDYPGDGFDEDWENERKRGR